MARNRGCQNFARLGRFWNPGKYYFLQFAKEVVDSINERTTEEGIPWARNSLIMTGLAPDIDGVWEVSQLTQELSLIVLDNLEYFHGFNPNAGEQ